MSRSFQVDSLTVRLYESRAELGKHAAARAGEKLRDLLRRTETVNIIFAAAPSQNEFLASLATEAGIDWKRVRAFHMDEYTGLPDHAPQRFGNFLKSAFFDVVPLREVHYLQGNSSDLVNECRRYAELLVRFPAHIVFMGIGENTHIAFNDPHVARFNDPEMVKVVDLDEACRQQQVNDGCFKTINDVPRNALSLTIPALMKAEQVFCMVPGKMKANAIRHTLRDTIAEKYPSTILRTHPSAELFIDSDSGALL